jgi:UDP-N-acetylmuramoyl-tripeptide--D-alanyl-D-alanine ligase
MDFDEVITVGRHFRDTGVSPHSFDSADELVSYLKENRIKSRNILLKGSRGIALEQILEFI